MKSKDIHFLDSIQFRIASIAVSLALFLCIGIYLHQQREVKEIVKAFYLEETARHTNSVAREMFDNPDNFKALCLNRYVIPKYAPVTFSQIYSWKIFDNKQIVSYSSNDIGIGKSFSIIAGDLDSFYSGRAIYKRKGNYYQIITPLFDLSKQQLGGLEIIYPVGPLFNLVARMQFRFFEPALLVFFALLVGFLTWQQIVQKPLAKFKTDIDKLRADRSTRLIPINRHDEIGQIILSFNNLLNDLRINIDELESTKQQTQAFSDELKSAYERLENQMAEMKEAKDQITELYMVIEKVNIDLDKKVIELSILNEVGRAISSILDLSQLLNMIIKWAAEEMGANQGAILLNDDNEGMTVEAIYNLDEKLLGQRIEPIGPDQVMSGEANEFIPAITIPLKGKGVTTGVINIGSKTTNRSFTSDDLNLLSTLANQAAIAIENAKLYETVQKGYFDTIQALTLAIEAKDVYTRGHSARVTEYAVTVASLIGLSPERVENLRYAAVLHDVGKIGIREEIIRKEGELTEAEYNMMKKHPTIGESIIEPIVFLEPVRAIIRSHHERYDGNGYPDGLRSEEISVEARILAMADAFDSMTSNRPYREEMTIETAIANLEEGAGTQFEPRLVSVFTEWIRENPPELIEKEETTDARTAQRSNSRALGDNSHRKKQTAL